MSWQNGQRVGVKGKRILDADLVALMLHLELDHDGLIEFRRGGI
ncbi:hypothetical protein PT974_06790 [Cladobotryum mycophilum]|uniref:Uncharacterized protein n=1 Tax=Cladobotryum mycophilum TaxID=491253 RepID=A0ABR0SNL1_9HYPO